MPLQLEFVAAASHAAFFPSPHAGEGQGEGAFSPSCHPRRLSPTFVIGDPVSEGIQYRYWAVNAHL